MNEIGALAEEYRLNAFLVGGAVRDLLLGHAHLDWDIVIEGDPAPVVHGLARRWDGKTRCHRRFGTYVLELPGGHHIDFATARTECYPRPGILPVVSPGNLDQDLFRRDFTINALALALNGDCRDRIIDCYGGLTDLKRRMLRVLHTKSFRDDPTRLFRLARFAGRGFGIARSTGQLAVRGVPYLRYLSDERIREEILAILAEKDPYPALCHLERWGVLNEVLPGVRLGREARRIGVVDTVGRRLHVMLQDLSPASRERVIEKLKLPRLLKKEVREHAASPRPAPILSGHDLILMGYRPGPLFRKILDDLARRVFSTREEACRFVFDKYHKKI